MTWSVSQGDTSPRFAPGHKEIWDRLIEIDHFLRVRMMQLGPLNPFLSVFSMTGIELLQCLVRNNVRGSGKVSTEYLSLLRKT